MSISSELLTLNNTKTAIRTAINNKGGSVEASAPFASYATAIANLPSGSGNPVVRSIDVSDFSGTTFDKYGNYITGVTIPSGVTSIGNNAFSGLTSISSITIPSGVTSIGNSTFLNCSGLTSITIPSGVTSIGFSAFSGCTSLTSITIPNSVTSLGTNVFQNCTSLTSVELSSGLTSIPTYAFNGCTSLSSVNIKNGITSIGTNVFQGCTSLTSVTLPSSLTTIGNEAFRNCSGLTSITLPSNVSSIGDSTFNSCTSLTSVELSSGLRSIGMYAFNGCTGLTSITIPSGVTSIGMYAFINCSGLTSITVLTPSAGQSWTPPTLGSNAFNNTNNCPIYVDEYYVLDLKTAWSAYASRIQAIPTPSATSITMTYNDGTSPGDWGDLEGCEETINVDSFEAASENSTFDSDIKAADLVAVEDNLGNDVTSQCTFTSSDYTKDDDGEGNYTWNLYTTVGDADEQVPHSATITATYGNLTGTFTIEWTTTSNCGGDEPEPDPEEEPEE